VIVIERRPAEVVADVRLRNRQARRLSHVPPVERAGFA